MRDWRQVTRMLSGSQNCSVVCRLGMCACVCRGRCVTGAWRCWRASWTSLGARAGQTVTDCPHQLLGSDLNRSLCAPFGASAAAGSRRPTPRALRGQQHGARRRNDRAHPEGREGAGVIAGEGWRGMMLCQLLDTRVRLTCRVRFAPRINTSSS